MIEIAGALEALPLAEHLRRSRWLYPMVNAGHILGIALLVGSIVPMDLRLLELRRQPDPASTIALLRPVAATGLLLAAACGGLLFIVQAREYLASPWFWAKMAVIALALLNVGLHLRLRHLPPTRRRIAAGLSIVLWPATLVLGRMIAYG